jgi:hypothetical protein
LLRSTTGPYQLDHLPTEFRRIKGVAPSTPIATFRQAIALPTLHMAEADKEIGNACVCISRVRTVLICSSLVTARRSLEAPAGGGHHE